MTPRRKIFTFAIDEDLAVALKHIKELEGVPESETVRRALRAWIRKNDVDPLAYARRRAAVDQRLDELARAGGAQPTPQDTKRRRVKPERNRPASRTRS